MIQELANIFQKGLESTFLGIGGGVEVGIAVSQLFNSAIVAKTK